MILDQKEVIVVDPKDFVYRSVDIVRTDEYYLNHRAISNYNCEGFSPQCCFPCKINRTPLHWERIWMSVGSLEYGSNGRADCRLIHLTLFRHCCSYCCCCCFQFVELILLRVKHPYNFVFLPRAMWMVNLCSKRRSTTDSFSVATSATDGLLPTTLAPTSERTGPKLNLKLKPKLTLA
jgi:hypothetical protein